MLCVRFRIERYCYGVRPSLLVELEVSSFFSVSRFDQIQRAFAIARVPRRTRSTVLWYSISSF